MENLFDIAGREFYLDLDTLSEFIKIDNNQEVSIDDLLNKEELIGGEDPNGEKDYVQYGQMIDVTKWEVVKVLIESILSENSITDETMGITKLNQDLSIPFRIAFNTLLVNKIMKEYGK